MLHRRTYNSSLDSDARPSPFSLLSPPASLISFFVLFTAGCGSSYDATVSGKVTIDGGPLTTGTVSFHPVGGGPVATGTIQSDGSFSVKTGTGEGLPPGDYKVTVVATDPPPPGDEETPGKPITAAAFGRLDSTPLHFTVQAGANNFDIPVAAAPTQ